MATTTPIELSAMTPEQRALFASIVDTAGGDRTARSMVSTGPCALGHIKFMLANGFDATIFVHSDSTGNSDFGPREMPYRTLDVIAEEFPNAQQIATAWNTGTNSYNAPVVVRPGAAGNPTLTIVNYAVPGAAAHYAIGAAYSGTSRMAWLSPDAIIINHGHNHVAGTLIEQVRGELLAVTEMWRLFHPGVPIAVCTQNPRYQDDLMMIAYAAWLHIKRLRPDIQIIDTYKPFVAAGKPAAYYIDAVGDGIHPGDAGFENIYVPAIRAEWKRSPAMCATALPSLYEANTSTMNLLDNGDFARWTTNPGAPDGWTADAGITAQKSTAVVRDPRLGYSVQLTATQAGGIRQSFPGYANLRGLPVTLSGWLYKPTGSTSNAGRLTLQAAAPSGGTVTITTRAYNQATSLNGWQPWIISGLVLPSGCTALTAILNQDTAAPSANPVYFDQVSLTPGFLPRGVR